MGSKVSMSKGGSGGGGEFDGGDDVDEFAEALVILRCAQALRCGFAWGEGAVAPGSVEAGAGVVLGEDAFEARVVALDGDHGVVHGLADKTEKLKRRRTEDGGRRTEDGGRWMVDGGQRA